MTRCSSATLTRALSDGMCGHVALDKPDTRWCSDGFEIGCNNSERAQSQTTGKNQFCLEQQRLLYKRGLR
jgi:hypothetical protein